MMAEQAAAVVTVEIDGHLFELASEADRFAERHDAQARRAAQQEQLRRPRDGAIGDLAAAPHRRFKLVANLPYNIATPVLSNLLLCPHVPHSMTVTIQKELADRIIASPSTKDYSALSVWMQSQCDGKSSRLPPSVFWPAPKVTSAILRLVVDPVRRTAIADLPYFHQITKALFLHRRKFLRANVVAAMKEHLDKEQVDAVLNEMGFTPDTRTEQLDVPTLIRLAEALRVVTPTWSL